jgi:hypothetical protein
MFLELLRDGFANLIDMTDVKECIWIKNLQLMQGTLTAINNYPFYTGNRSFSKY